jgi:hypothetical protein
VIGDEPGSTHEDQDLLETDLSQSEGRVIGPLPRNALPWTELPNDMR